MGEEQAKTVKRRRVFYIPGYDPIHPRRYRELYRTESAEQAKISGYKIELKPKTGDGPYGWNVTGTIDGATTEAEFEVLIWSDIVRDSMSNSIPATYLHLVRTAWTYITTGVLRRLMWLRKGPVIAALYPVGMLLLQLLVAVLVGFLVVTAVEALGGLIIGGLLSMIPEEGRFTDWFNSLSMGVAGSVFQGLLLLLSILMYVLWAVIIVLVLRFFKAKDGKIFAYYLMHDYAYSARYGGANPPELEVRMEEFGALISAALMSDVDEVLVVGHSSGAHLAVSVLADLIRKGRVKHDGPKLSFLSLGQVVPMVSFLPEAKRLRGDLNFLSGCEEVTWIDVTAPGDGCAFALCDPVAVTGVSPPGKRWPLVFSAAFTQTLSPERWQDLRWRFFRLHFQYLCAFDRPKDYDYFQITAGPLTLRERYKDRAPSRSRIDEPCSGYTDMV